MLATGVLHAEPIQFNRDIRPILSENCFKCHGPDKNQRKAKLRLDVREVAIEKEAIVPGDADRSKVIQHIFATDPEEIMPPAKSGKKLSDPQKDLLRRWIAAGAQYQPHWAYIPPTRPPIPAVRDAVWMRNPLDAFVLHELESRNLRPTAEADKRTLLRRLSLDLIGLPPTPEEVKAFLADTRPGAYERQVERLLASPHFGERMAVPWLDVVRFADTVGYHGDQNENVFPYRDYVIDAFNRNKPFDQFTIEQLAGDLVEHPTAESRVASAFNRLNMMTREGGAQPKEYMAKYAADRVRTVSMAWLGSTMGCAECHDHKYDPFSTKDFYSMEAFFSDMKQWGVYADYNYTPNPDLRGIGNDHHFPPEIQVDSPYLQRRMAMLRAQQGQLCTQAAALIKADKSRQAVFADWRKESREFLKQWPSGWTTPLPGVDIKFKDTNQVAAESFNIGSNSTVVLGNKPHEGLKLRLPLTNQWLAAIRLEIVPREGAVETVNRRKKRNGATITLAASLRSTGTRTPRPRVSAQPARADEASALLSGKETRLTFYDAEADHKEERYANGLPIIGIKDQWRISTDHEQQTAVWLLEKPIRTHEGDELVVDLGNAMIASVRVSASPFAAAESLKAGCGEPLRKALGGFPNASQSELLHRTYLLSTSPAPGGATATNLLGQFRALQNEVRQCRSGRAYCVVTEAREPSVTRVLPRGNWQDDSGEIVQPAGPHFLPQVPNPDSRRLSRLDLARWLVSPDNPLTARAMVNRLWKQFFGTGLSTVVDDLGAQGDWPVYPELLDWLACEFMSPAFSKLETRNAVHPWDVKHVVRLMVTSAIYRQDSNPRPELVELDPDNRLLARQTPRRLEAEFVRDNALAIAGLLNPEIGGPSVHPYQPPGYYANLQFPDRDYVADKDDRQYRRGVYMHWQRTFLQPMLANFDAPSREECTANRLVSNTPQQALTLLNDPSFVEAARVLASGARPSSAAARSASAAVSDHPRAAPPAELAAPGDGRAPPEVTLVSTAGQKPAGTQDRQHLNLIFERALARPAKEKEMQSLLDFLAGQCDYYRANPEEAAKLLRVGIAPTPTGGTSELAAWTQVCRVILNLQEAITRY